MDCNAERYVDNLPYMWYRESGYGQMKAKRVIGVLLVVLGASMAIFYAAHVTYPRRILDGFDTRHDIYGQCQHNIIVIVAVT